MLYVCKHMHVTCVCMYLYVHMYVCVRLYMCVHVCQCVLVYVYMCLRVCCVLKRVCVSVYACVSVCMFVYKCIVCDATMVQCSHGNYTTMTTWYCCHSNTFTIHNFLCITYYLRICVYECIKTCRKLYIIVRNAISIYH